MSLLTIVSDARSRLNLGTVSSVFSNEDLGVVQMMGLLQDIGDELAERNFWQRLNIAGTITGDGSTTLWTVPADFSGLSPGLQFTSNLYPMFNLNGPVTNEELARLKAFPIAPIRPVWRIINNQIEFWPALQNGEIVTYNYYSPNWIYTVALTRVARWTADTDISLIDEKVLTRGLEWRWLAAKGFDYAEAFRRYEQSLDRADGRQDTGRIVTMASRPTYGDSVWPGVLPIY